MTTTPFKFGPSSPEFWEAVGKHRALELIKKYNWTEWYDYRSDAENLRLLSKSPHRFAAAEAAALGYPIEVVKAMVRYDEDGEYATIALPCGVMQIRNDGVWFTAKSGDPDVRGLSPDPVLGLQTFLLSEMTTEWFPDGVFASDGRRVPRSTVSCLHDGNPLMIYDSRKGVAWPWNGSLHFRDFGHRPTLPDYKKLTEEYVEDANAKGRRVSAIAAELSNYARVLAMCGSDSGEVHTFSTDAGVRVKKLGLVIKAMYDGAELLDAVSAQFTDHVQMLCPLNWLTGGNEVRGRVTLSWFSHLVNATVSADRRSYIIRDIFGRKIQHDFLYAWDPTSRPYFKTRFTVNETAVNLETS